MQRITISLPDDVAAALVREARRREISASRLTRGALAEHLGLSEDEPRPVPIAALGRSGQKSTGRDMEQLLAQERNERPRRR